MSPQAQNVLRVLQLLRAVYANGGFAPDSRSSSMPAAPTFEVGTGTGLTVALTASQLFQQTSAVAFQNLDNMLAYYLTGLAGNHGIDRNALNQLLEDLNSALSAVGPDAYTAAGAQHVQAIITTALQQGDALVGGGQATAAQTAAAIDELTAQFLDNVYDRNYQGALPVAASGAAPGAASGVASQAISVAMSELGKPYVWGATGPDSFDCSGLVQYAARAAGVSLPRTSQEQYQQLPKVNPADIRPGDLIFPGSEFNGGSPTHVMMYIGNGQCVEAPHTGATVCVIALPASFAASRWT
ncbi:C40 family peptidase [Nocardia tengchongensis]|uniref:C40 family peptidase n=2 Tax=Nocardia tengchongensis TaxID=2055889 RepID=UPI0036BDF89C